MSKFLKAGAIGFFILAALNLVVLIITVVSGHGALFGTYLFPVIGLALLGAACWAIGAHEQKRHSIGADKK